MLMGSYSLQYTFFVQLMLSFSRGDCNYIATGNGNRTHSGCTFPAVHLGRHVKSPHSKKHRPTLVHLLRFPNLIKCDWVGVTSGEI